VGVGRDLPPENTHGTIKRSKAMHTPATPSGATEPGSEPADFIDDENVKSECDERRLDALDDIVAILSGTEWDASTLEEVADVLRQAGYSIEDFIVGGENR